MQPRDWFTGTVLALSACGALLICVLITCGCLWFAVVDP